MAETGEKEGKTATRVEAVSDLHLNWWKDFGEGWIRSLIPQAEILVIAGDVADHHWFSLGPELLEQLCRKYQHVLFVPGNHDYYGTSLESGDERFRALEETIPSLHVLDGDTITISGTTFAGTTLWFRDGPLNAAHSKYLSDFHLIAGFRRTVYQRNEECLRFLDSLEDVDVVVTHHLPSDRSIASFYEGDELNKFFLCDVEEVICTARPKLWIHGHTHFPCDYIFDETRVVCHPRGYRGTHEGAGGDPDNYKPLILEL